MQPTSTDPFSISGLASSAWQDFRKTCHALIVFDLLVKFLEAWLLIPGIALVLSAALSRAGHVAVSNLDVLGFLLSPTGLLYAAFFGVVTVALVLLEQSGIMVISALMNSPASPVRKPNFFFLLTKLLQVVQLSAWILALLTLALAPFLLLAWLTYQALLSQHDINYYLAERPPAFWIAGSLGGVLLFGALAAAATVAVRWIFALPILLFENVSARTALRVSAERVRGAGWRIGILLFGWLLASLVLGLVLAGSFRYFAATVLRNAGEHPVILILGLLCAQGVLLALSTFVMAVGQGLLTRRLYLLRGGQAGLSPVAENEMVSSTDRLPSPWLPRLIYLPLLLPLLAPVLIWRDLSHFLSERPPVQITAHRGHSRAAPENTLSAVRKAIDSKADFAEIDVQLTADGVVVLLHDRDLKRVGGVPLRIDEIDFADARKLDVGGWFGPAFVGERVPTLAEVIDLSRGRIKLNIEMKFYGPDRRLAQEVARLVREKNFESECLVTSFEYDAVLESKRQDSRIRMGLIVANALGDVSRLDVDALSVRADWLTDAALRSAHHAGKEVHVWTVNDPGQMTRFMKRGVDNILTDDPDLAIHTREEWTQLTNPERLVLASQLLLGLDP
jgi:glycerophosphoryl diester phosphodiesterase